MLILMWVFYTVIHFLYFSVNRLGRIPVTIISLLQIHKISKEVNWQVLFATDTDHTTQYLDLSCSFNGRIEAGQF